MVVDRNGMIHNQEGEYSGSAATRLHGADDLETDPDIRFEQDAKNAISHAISRIDTMPRSEKTMSLLRQAIGECSNDYEETPLNAYRFTPSRDYERQLKQSGWWDDEQIQENITGGGWNPQHDDYARVNDQGDIEGCSRRQADDPIWTNRRTILTNLTVDGDSHVSVDTVHGLAAL